MPTVSLPKLRFVTSVDGSLAKTIAERLLDSSPSPASDIDESFRSHLSAAGISAEAFLPRWMDAVIVGEDPDAAADSAFQRAKANRLSGGHGESPRGRPQPWKTRLKELWNEAVVGHPKLPEQLPLRSRPIRDGWETYGPGILRTIERRIWYSEANGSVVPEDWWPSQITARMLHPVRGGDGDLCIDGESFWFEATLTNVDPRIPEVMRLAWLALRLSLLRHVRTRSGRLDWFRRWQWASVPLVLDAGREVGLLSHPVAAADVVKLWRWESPAIAREVDRWWKSVPEETPIPIALRTLDTEAIRNQIESS